MVRWEPQVEKALCFPDVEGIVRAAMRILTEEITHIKRVTRDIYPPVLITISLTNVEE